MRQKLTHVLKLLIFHGNLQKNQVKAAIVNAFLANAMSIRPPTQHNAEHRDTNLNNNMYLHVNNP